jgi:G2/mitotic-specific cyclin 1/2
VSRITKSKVSVLAVKSNVKASVLSAKSTAKTVLKPVENRVQKHVPSTPKSKKSETFNISFTSIKNPFSVPKKKSLVYFDPLLVEEYEQEIYEYWRELEVDLRVDPLYMSKQAELDWDMRKVMISWLVEIHSQFKMTPETLHLTIHLIDKTMSNKTISVGKLQLVGVTALLIAAKFEEILAPSVQDLSYFTDYCYSGEEIVRAERHLLGIVRYQIGCPSPLQFLKRMIKGNTDVRLWNLSSYFIEVLLLDHENLKYLSSHLAASALFLSIKVLYDGDWVLLVN